MELNQLRYFKAVADTGKIVKAADAMFVTPPTISIALSQMEAELGVKLFIRHSHHLEITPQGKIFAEYAEQILRLFRRACRELIESAAEDSEQVYIAVSTSNIWLDLLAAYARQYPDSPFSTTTITNMDILSGQFTERYCCLLASDDDMAQVPKNGLEELLLFTDTPAVMIYDSHPLASKSVISVDDLGTERLIWPRMDQYVIGKILGALEKSGIYLPTISSYSQLLCDTLVAQGSAIAVTTMHAAHQNAGNLRFIPLDLSPEVSWNIRLFLHKNRPLRPAEEQFIFFLLSFFGKQKTELP